MAKVSKRPAVFVVGAFPPPVHGLSNVNEAMAERLSGHARIVKFDTAARARARDGWTRLLAWLGTGLLLLRFAVLASVQRPSSIYIGLSGGRGQLLDGMFATMGNLLRIPVFFHHHSFRYINKPSPLTRMVFRLAGNATHIALCADMAARLEHQYPASVRHTVVLSNIALFPAAQRCCTRVRGKRPLTLGFLSNITREKGIFAFFDVLTVLERRGIPIRAIVAGPVANAITSGFEVALAQHAFAQHIGPTSGDDKKKFYEAIDLLVFPSHYENEAEPLTVNEALSFGVPVIASDKGCIPSILRWGGGVFVVDDDRMVESIADFVAKIAKSPDIYEQFSRGAVASVMDHAADHNVALSRLLGLLVQTTRVTPKSPTG